jgi:hypothetical protein
MSPDQHARALRLADALDELDSAFSATGVCGEAADLLRELAAEPVSVPLPDKSHLQALRESLPSVRDRLRAIYVEQTGENPWEDDDA